MKDLLYYLVSNLVKDKQSIQIEEAKDKDVYILTIIANDADYGKIIGKNGRVIHSIRTLMKIYGMNHNKKIIVKVGK